MPIMKIIPNTSKLILMSYFDKCILIDGCEKIFTYNENNYFFQPDVQFFKEHFASSLLECSFSFLPHFGHSIFMYLLMHNLQCSEI